MIGQSHSVPLIGRTSADMYSDMILHQNFSIAKMLAILISEMEFNLILFGSQKKNSLE